MKPKQILLMNELLTEMVQEVNPDYSVICDGAFYCDVAFDYKFDASPAMYNFDFKFTEIGVKGEFGPVHLEGKLNLYDKDATYGDGFRGAVRCKFPMDITASATVQFGNIKKGSPAKNINYFYVDGAVNLGDAASII